MGKLLASQHETLRLHPRPSYEAGWASVILGLGGREADSEGSETSAPDSVKDPVLKIG